MENKKKTDTTTRARVTRLCHPRVLGPETTKMHMQE
jgi:hypothetical protein